MNSLKTLFVMAVLGIIAYAVYVSINNNSAPSDPQPWGEPTVEMPGAGQTDPNTATAPPFVPGSTATTSLPSGQPTGSATVPNDPTTIGASMPSATTVGAPTDRYAASGPGARPNVPDPRGDYTGIGNPPSATVTGVNPLGSTAPATGVGPAAGMGQAPPAGIGSPAPSPGAVPNATQLAMPTPRGSFSAFAQEAQRKLDEGRLSEVLAELTPWRNAPQLSPEQAGQVQGLLNQLAGTVVYSQQHLLEPPYTVRQGDTLETIGRQYNVPGKLLANINGIRNPQDVQPGQQLKVVRGPFDAEISLDKYELVLTLQGRYAGRFSVGLGRDQQTLAGTHIVREKTDRPPQAGSSPIGTTGNPATSGPWIGLNGQVGIHGTTNPQDVGRPGGNGWISLANGDLGDVYNILSVGSRVVIRR